MTTVCMFTSVHSPFDYRVFHREAQALVEAGYQLALIAPHRRAETVSGVRIVPVPPPRNRIERMFLTTGHILQRALRERADVYHFHDAELLPVAALLKFFRKRVIYDVHDIIAESLLVRPYIPVRLRRPLAAFIDRLERMIASTFDFVITATDAIELRYTSVGIRARAVKNYPLQQPDLMSERRYDRPRLTLIFAGAIYRERGVLEMVRACNQLDDLDLHIDMYGGIAPATLLDEIRALDRHRRVTYHGVVPFERAIQAMQQADMGYICDYPEPRKIDALPVKLFEYMSVGLPVVASDFPIWKEIVVGSGCGICVDPLDVPAIVNAIRRLCTHPDLRREMGQNARRAVQEKYNWKAERSNLLQIYREVCS